MTEKKIRPFAPIISANNGEAKSRISHCGIIYSTPVKAARLK
ncbi:MAG: hypothetical protein PHE06_00060 [Lachnospiraceae bacterium]|nr:hypothetical protein [Lachnospiraceae bacterium]